MGPTTSSVSNTSDITVKELRERVRSVFVLALPAGSAARQIAERAAPSGSSYLRGKQGFERAATELRGLPDSSGGERIRLRRTDGKLSAAGAIIEDWSKASADRSSLFDEAGATGPTLLIVDINGIDTNSLWSDDTDGEPAITKGATGATMTLFEGAPSLQRNKQPDPDNGILQTLRGDQVSVKRRGNTSRRDRKPNLCVLLDDDDIAGFPKQLNLNNCIRDPAYQRMRLAWSLLDEARCPVQPCAYAELTLNGQYQGTYVALAPIDEFYFKKYFPKAKNRAVFRGQYGDIEGGATLELRGKEGKNYFTAKRKESRTYEPRLDTEDVSYEGLASFIATLHQFADPRDPKFASAMESIFDVATFLRVMAVINLLGSWDAYYLNAQNYFLHLATGGASGGAAPFVSFCPYDQDSVLGVSWPGQQRNWQDKDILFRGTEMGKLPLLLRILQNPRFQAYYIDFMNWFVHSRFTPERVAAKKAALWKTLEQSVYLEADSPHGTPFTQRPWTNDEVYRHAIGDEQFNATAWAVAGLQVTGILKFVEARRAKVLEQLTSETLGSSKLDFDSDNWELR